MKFVFADGHVEHHEVKSATEHTFLRRLIPECIQAPTPTTMPDKVFFELKVAIDHNPRGTPPRPPRILGGTPMTRGILLGALVLSLLPGPTKAQDLVPMDRDGTPGFWMSSPDGRTVLEALTNERSYQLQLQYFRDAQEARTAEVQSLRGALEASSRIEHSLRTEVGRLSRPWRTPWVWLTVGLLAGGLLVTFGPTT